MLVQYDNLVISSFYLWLDNMILTKGQAYTNHSSRLYPSKQVYNGYYQYNFPFAQLVSDFSVAGANIPTGLYLNSTFVPVGQSGLAAINFEKGCAYFSTGLSNSVTVSGNYAIKDINITLPNTPDLKVLFETKLNLRPKSTYNIPSTGLANDELSYPMIAIRQTNSNSKPWAFGGQKEIKNDIGCYIFTDSIYLLNSCQSLLRDRLHDYVPLLDANEMPFNSLGYYKNNIPYNYDTITANKVGNNSGILISEVIISDFTKRGLFQEIQSITTDCYFGVCEFELSKPRLT